MNIDKIFHVISDAYARDVEISVEKPEFSSYPFPQAWKGHNDAIKKILKNKISILDFPTGYGKTVVYLTAAKESDLRTIVIVPRNALQDQIRRTYTKMMKIPILCLYDRVKMCNKGTKPPCLTKFKKNGKWYVKVGDEIVKYPCPDCPYEMVKAMIKIILRENKGMAVLNQGNFWYFKPYADFIVIDEADETIKAMVNAVSYPDVCEEEDPIKVLGWMHDKISEDIRSIEKCLEKIRGETQLEYYNAKLKELQRKLRKISFFLECPPEKLITYVRGRTTYVELFDNPINIAKSLFPHAKICLVSATLTNGSGGNYNNNSTNNDNYLYKARVIYAPVGNLSSRNVFVERNYDLLEKAVEVIVKTYDFTCKLTGMKKAPIHCGNLGKHGLTIYELLVAGGYEAVLMEEGNQMEAIKQFLQEDVDFLCAVSIEYGFDWSFSPIQYILKVPFADLGDPRLRAIKKLLGSKFHEWYNWDALSRLIQACGRNSRNPNDFGITIILDSCFGRLYKRFEDRIPKWFKDRLIWLEENDKGDKNEQ